MGSEHQPFGDQDQSRNEYREKAGPFEFRFEGLKDGYRVTVKGNESKIRQNRRVRRSFMSFLDEVSRAGIWMPRPFRWLLRIWRRYNNR